MTSLGVALYHHLPPARITPRISGLIDDLGATRLDDPDDVQERAVAPYRLGLLLDTPLEPSRLEHILELADALDVDYGFLTPISSPEAAHDELFWPATAHLQSTPEARHHNNAWLHVMRAFGRPEVGDGIPGIYWGNILGTRIINTLRDHNDWDALEATADLRYLEESGTVAFILSPQPLPAHHPDIAQRARTLGDITSPIHLMGRALEHALSGNPLLLQTLANTGDLRLLPALAQEDTLDAFRTLLPPEDAQDLESLQDAHAYLLRTRDARPLGYGEPATPLPSTEPEKEAPQPEPQPSSETPTDTEPTTSEPPPLGRWQLSALHPTSLRLAVDDLVWTHPTLLQLALSNALPVPLTLSRVCALHRNENALLHIALAALEDTPTLDPRDRHTTTLTLAQPIPRLEDTLTLSASLHYRFRDVVVDLDAFDNRVSTPLEPWPIAVTARRRGDALLIALTNTAREHFTTWRLWTGHASDPSKHGLRVEGSAPLLAHTTTHIRLPLTAPVEAQVLWFEGEAAAELTLAELQFAPDHSPPT